MKVALYDFEVCVPNEWKVVIGPKSEYKAGMVAFKPSSDPNETLDLIWEDLTKHKERNPDVEAFIENYFNNMRKNSEIKSFECKRGDVIRRGDHSFLPHEFTYLYKRYMRKAFDQKIIGMAMYDLHSNRFAIFYTKIDPKKGRADEEALRAAIGSLNCTCCNQP